MTSRNKGILTDIQLFEVSLVDDPANTEAKVTLFKRAEETEKTLTPAQKEKLQTLMSEGKSREQALAIVLNMSEKRSDSMDAKELQKKLDDLQAELKKAKDDSKAEVEKLQGEMTALEKALGENNIKVEKSEDGLKISVEKSEKEEMIEFEGEMIAKSSVPAPILKKLQEQSNALKDLQKKAELADFNKRAADTFPNLKGDEATKGQLLKAVEGLKEEVSKAVMETLKAADAATDELFKAVGEEDHGELSDEQTALNKMVDDYATEHGVSKAQAFSKVTESGPGLKLLAKQREAEARTRH